MDQHPKVYGHKAPAAPNYFGAIDGITDTAISGFAINLRDIQKHPIVHIYNGVQSLGSAICDMLRVDLLQMGAGDGRCGFTILLKQSLQTGCDIRAVISDEHGEFELPHKIVISDDFSSNISNGPVEGFAVSAQENNDAEETKSRLHGDILKKAGKWAEAQAAYSTHVNIFREDAIAWQNIAHSAMALGDLQTAELACRVAIHWKPKDAKHHLLHGDLLKGLGKFQEAAKAYKCSFALLPTRAASVRAEALGDFSSTIDSKIARNPEFCCEISDLFYVMSEHQNVSGIQRVQLGLVSYILNTPNDPEISKPKLLIWGNDQLFEISNSLLAEVIALIDNPAADFNERIAKVNQLQDEAILFSPIEGDTILLTGAVWLPQIRSDITRGHARLKQSGAKLGIYLYDFIPLTDASYCHQYLTERFSLSFASTLPHCDFALSISEYVGAEFTRLLREGSYPRIPVITVPLAHSFGVLAGPKKQDCRWSNSISALEGKEYVLAVSSISMHKNHILLVQIWNLLIQMGIEPPQLVIAGRKSFGSDEFFRALETTRYLDGRVHVLQDLDDIDISQLYQNCLFTMFPSLVEGWGLPVGESLAHGKVCISSNTTSMPEVGGDFVVYIDPLNIRGSTNVVIDLLNDRAKLNLLEQRIQNEFKPRNWNDFSETLIAKAKMLSASLTDNTIPISLDADKILRLQPNELTWLYGRKLPPFADIAKQVLLRGILTNGWALPEASGAWMTARQAHLSIPVKSLPGQIVSLALMLTITFATRFDLRIKVISKVGNKSRIVHGHNQNALLLCIDGVVDRAGYVSVQIDVDHKIPTPSAVFPRVSLAKLMVLKAPLSELQILPPYEVFGLTTLVDDRRQMIMPFNSKTIAAAARKQSILLDGWQLSEATETWIDGTKACIQFCAPDSSGITVRVVLNFVAKPNSRFYLKALSRCGSISTFRFLQNSRPEFRIWLDCVVGQDGMVSIDLDVVDVDKSHSLLSPLAIVSVVYGPDLHKLTEVLMFSVPDNTLHEDILNGDIGFVITGHVKGSYSLASVNRSLANALEGYRPGTVRIAQVEGGATRDLTEMSDYDRQAMSIIMQRPAHDDGPIVVIAQHWPVLPKLSGADLSVAYVFWEESLAPRDMVQQLNDTYSGIMVPTKSVEKALIDSGISLPIRVVGMAPDLKKFMQVGDRRAARQYQRHSSEEPFTFLHVSSCFPRKGVDVLLRAFAKAFRKGDPVRLLIKTFPNPHNDVAQQIAQLQARDHSAPSIELIDRDISLRQMLDLYERSDSMVLPTRGEGFNLPAAEAMAAGLSLIVTGYGGQADFVDPHISRVLNYEFAASRSHLNSPGSVWVDPDEEDLANAMRETVSMADTPATISRLNAARQRASELADSSQWAARVTRAASNLLYAGRATPPKVALVTTWNIRCGIAEYSRLLVKAYPNSSRDMIILCNDDPSLVDASSAGDPIVRIAWKNRSHESIETLIREIESTDAQIVLIQHHQALIKPLSLGALLADSRLADRHIVLTLHNVQDLFLDTEANRVLVPALANVSRVLVHTVRDLGLLKAQGLVTNVAMIPHGLSTSILTPLPTRHLSSVSNVVIGTYGFFLPHKGVSKLIEAFASLRHSWPEMRLRLVNAEYPDPISSNELALCRELARSFGVDDAIEWYTDFLPNQQSLSLLNGCDLVVLPYDNSSESSSAAVRSALSSLTPVAVTPVSIFDDVGDIVLRFDGTDVQSIVNGIKWILENQSARESIQQRAVEWLSQNNWNVVTNRMMSMFIGLLNQEPMLETTYRW